MKFDAVKPDAPITTDQLIDYWRERTECLEEWVCELLRKNQILRMNLEKEQSPLGHGEEKALTFSFLSLYQPPISSNRGVFRKGFPEFAFEPEEEPCPRKECAEIREWVIQSALISESLSSTNN